MRRGWTACLTRVLAAPLRVDHPAGDVSPRTATDRPSQPPNLVPRIRLVLCRLGCDRPVHKTAQPRRRRIPVELVAAPARLDHSFGWPGAFGGRNHHCPATRFDDLRSAGQRGNRVGPIAPTYYQLTRTSLRHCSITSWRPSA